jgi:hypothetical protein
MLFSGHYAVRLHNSRRTDGRQCKNAEKPMPTAGQAEAGEGDEGGKEE